MRSRKLILAAVGLAVPVLVALWAVWSMVLPLGGESWHAIVNIPKGASAGHIGQILAERRVIRSAAGFDLLARITNQSSKLKPGAYKLSPSMSPAQIMEKIVKGEVSARWITIPEGFTIRQIGERLAQKGFVNEERFLLLATNAGAIDVGFPHGDNLEGYLFPDTYLIPIGSTEEAVIRQMLVTFDKKVRGYVSSQPSDLPLDKVVILASLIEREAKVPKDRPLVSAVMRNRLNKGMRLEIDATVLYALGRHKSRVLYSDLEVDSPYNTYRNAGLPPGPIANPGLDCIKAALNPANVDYLYYVARSDGSHIFSRTMAEHQHAIRLARGEPLSKLLKLLCPDESVDSLPLIDLEDLKRRRIEALLVDLDNTLVPWRSHDLSPEVVDWVARACKDMKLCIVSNSRTPRRMQALAERLGISYVKRGGKPRRVGFRAALKLLGIEPSKAAVIGDQIFTDILGGNRLGAHTILVRPIHRREFFGTKISRIVERLLLRTMERRGMIGNRTPIPTCEGEQLANSDGQTRTEQ